MSHKSHEPTSPDESDSWFKHRFGDGDGGVSDPDENGVSDIKDASTKATVILEVFDTVGFREAHDAVEAAGNVAPDHQAAWHEVSNSVLANVQHFLDSLDALESAGGWQGDTHDAAIKNVTASLDKARDVASVMSSVGSLVGNFDWMMRSTRGYLDQWMNQYEQDLHDFPNQTDVVNESYSLYARQVMKKFYSPAIDTLAKKNPDFDAIHQTDTPTTTQPSPPSPPNFSSNGGSDYGGSGAGRFEGSGGAGTGGGTDGQGGAANYKQSPPSFSKSNAQMPTDPGMGQQSGAGGTPPSFQSPNVGSGGDPTASNPNAGGSLSVQPSSRGTGGGPSGTPPSFQSPDFSIPTDPGSGGVGSGGGAGFEDSSLRGALTNALGSSKKADQVADSMKNNPQFAADFSRALDNAGGDISRALNDPSVQSDLNSALGGSGGAAANSFRGAPNFSTDTSGATDGTSGFTGPDSSEFASGGQQGAGLSQSAQDLQPMSSALGAASQAAGQLGQGMTGTPPRFPGLNADALHAADAMRAAGAGGGGAGGGGIGGRAGLPQGQVPGVPVAATRTPSELSAFGGGSGSGGMGAGAGMPPGGGAPPGGQRGGDAGGKAHASNKILRSKRNGKDVAGEPAAVVAVIGDEGAGGADDPQPARP